MKLAMYCIYDSKSLSFSQPFVLPSDAEAIRGFQHILSDPQSKFATYPEDFELYSIGSIDDKSGWLEPKNPEKLTTALAAKAEIIERSKAALELAKTARNIQLTTAEVSPQGQAEGAIPTLQDMINITAPN